MKVAIITITDGQNYGNRLQNYALQKSLMDLGCEVETVKRRTHRDLTWIGWQKKKVKIIIKRMVGRNNDLHRLLRKRTFDSFNKYIKFSKSVLHNNVAPKGIEHQYDYFIVGSDQVWNAGFRIIREDIMNYLLSFAPNDKRIAYAASFGTDRLAEGYEQAFRDELLKFKTISVREVSGVKLVKECGIEAEVVLDPTMLLTVQDWLKIAKKPTYVKDMPFIVTYFLGGRDIKVQNYIRSIAGNKKVYNLEIESAPMESIDSTEVFSTSPDEFVWLIANADCVLTDSFHATVFSILFHKPFCIFERKVIDDSYKIGSRIDTLLGLFHLERFRNIDFSLEIKPEKYEVIDIERVLKQEREKSINFLRRALEIND